MQGASESVDDRTPSETIHPLNFGTPGKAGGEAPQGAAASFYFRDEAVRCLADFFTAKGLAALKQEDREERWHPDWVCYQAKHALYAQLLVPVAYSAHGGGFDLLRYCRLLEVFAYFSPSHGYSLQVTFLGFFSVMMGTNEALKREAVAALEAGGLMAFGISEREHGSDLLATALSVDEAPGGTLIASGAKYYIGNAQAAALMPVLGCRRRRRRAPVGKDDASPDDRPGRQPIVLLAVRPAQAPAMVEIRKIHTLGVRSAFVGSFRLDGHPLPQSDIIAEGRSAWDAIFGTVTLGKFFLGFGSIGICEHALQEALAHLRSRFLYGKPAIDMAHLRSSLAEAIARITAMKLYAYRALDYLQAASATDRRYLLFCAVQKARVGTEGVKVMSILSECVGARGFEGDSYIEMALRDVQLIPGLEGSMHINLRSATQFMPRYFARAGESLPDPPSLFGKSLAPENPYLYEARSIPARHVAFRHFLEAYRPLATIPNVVLFARQTAAFRRFSSQLPPEKLADLQLDVALGQAVAWCAYGQLIAENSRRLGLDRAVVSAIFGFLVSELSICALRLAGLPAMAESTRGEALWRMVKTARPLPGEVEALIGLCPPPPA
jgi:acyl-CoA dehydrogenase